MAVAPSLVLQVVCSGRMPSSHKLRLKNTVQCIWQVMFKSAFQKKLTQSSLMRVSTGPFLLVKMGVLQAASLFSGIGLLQNKLASKMANLSLKYPSSKPLSDRVCFFTPNISIFSSVSAGFQMCCWRTVRMRPLNHCSHCLVGLVFCSRDPGKMPYNETASLHNKTSRL